MIIYKMLKRHIEFESEKEKEREKEINTNVNKKYKSGDIILIDDEYCLKCDFYVKTNIFTKWFVKTQCPLCDENITECLGLEQYFNERTSNNNVNLTKLFSHIRKSHTDDLVCIKNISSDVKKEIVKFTLKKKVIL